MVYYRVRVTISVGFVNLMGGYLVFTSERVLLVLRSNKAFWFALLRVPHRGWLLSCFVASQQATTPGEEESNRVAQQKD